jgi:xylulokinase
MPLYLGLDASTQSLTAIVVEITGLDRRIVFQHSLNFDRDLPEYGTVAGVRQGEQPGVVYAPPQMWADALDRVMGLLAATALDVEDLRAVAGSAQQHGSVYLNQSAEAQLSQLDATAPLAPQLGAIFARPEAPVWLDASTTAECREIEAAIGGADTLRAITGSTACERFTGPQIRKFYKEQPDGYAATARIHLVSSFMATLLAGATAPIDPGDGSGMNLMELAANSWSPAALDATAPDLLEKLPPIRPSWDRAGRLSRYWQHRYSFPPAAIINWSGDNPSSLIGTGVIRPGVLAVSLGTSDTVFACTSHPGPRPSHLFRSPTGELMSLVCFRNGSLAREWIRFEHRLDWHAVARLLEERPGNDGYVMLPWLESEITPPVPHAGVRRFGFDRLDTGKNVRGLIEGQMMAMANHAADVTSDPIERIIATGGAATNFALLQVMANVFGADVHRLDVQNSAALGAALRAYHADRLAGEEPVSWKTVVSGFTEPNPAHRVSPNPRLVAIYEALRREYAILEKLHQDRHPIC